MIYIKFFFVLFFLSIVTYGNSNSQKKINPDSLRYKIAYTSRCEKAPIVDGILDDASWAEAIPLEDFHQIEPIEFGVPSEKTTV